MTPDNKSPKFASAERWIVFCQVGDKEYILDNRVFTRFSDAIIANEAAGWPGTTLELFYRKP